MACSGKTTNLELPQYLGSDHPDFLGEINGAYQKLDKAYAELKAEFALLEARVKVLEGSD